MQILNSDLDGLLFVLFGLLQLRFKIFNRVLVVFSDLVAFSFELRVELLNCVVFFFEQLLNECFLRFELAD